MKLTKLEKTLATLEIITEREIAPGRRQIFMLKWLQMHWNQSSVFKSDNLYLQSDKFQKLILLTLE